MSFESPFWLKRRMTYIFKLLQVYLLCNHIMRSQIQSTLFISKLKGPSETLRDIRASTYQIFKIEKIQIAQPNFTNEYIIRLL